MNYSQQYILHKPLHPLLPENIFNPLLWCFLDLKNNMFHRLFFLTHKQACLVFSICVLFVY